MKKTYKLKKSVKVVLTIMLIAVMAGMYNVASRNGANTNVALFGWLMIGLNGFVAASLWNE